MWIKNNEVIILNDLKLFWFFGFRTPVSQQRLPTVPGILMGNYLIIFLLPQLSESNVDVCCQGRIWNNLAE